jgi:coproporphyrinogen III oxidase-like Fe-S oxidoreductase
MVGLPFDTEKTIEESFAQATELDFDEFAVYPLIPYPGTLVAQFPENFGYEIIDKDFTKYVQMGRNKMTCMALQHRNFSPNDVRRWLAIATSILSKHAIHMSQSTLA